MAVSPGKLRDKLWLLLDNPHSSPAAQRFSNFMTFFVVMSILMFFAQTLPELQPRGPMAKACRQDTIQKWCKLLKYLHVYLKQQHGLLAFPPDFVIVLLRAFPLDFGLSFCFWL